MISINKLMEIKKNNFKYTKYKFNKNNYKFAYNKLIIILYIYLFY